METVKQDGIAVTSATTGTASTSDAVYRIPSDKAYIQSEEAAAEDKTFTQDELNKIIGERLARESAKYGDYEELKEKAAKYDKIEEESKSELQKAQERTEALENELNSLKKQEEVRKVRETVSQETGVPVDLLTGETEEECKAQAEKIKAYAQPGAYPEVKDGGEVRKSSSGSTRDQFAEWMNQSL